MKKPPREDSQNSPLFPNTATDFRKYIRHDYIILRVRDITILLTLKQIDKLVQRQCYLKLDYNCSKRAFHSKLVLLSEEKNSLHILLVTLEVLESHHVLYLEVKTHIEYQILIFA